MATDGISIPSPSVFLRPSTPSEAPTTLASDNKSAKSRTAKTRTTSSVAKATATSAEQPRAKQSKSRNGCSTCKAKRLKCDEEKPTCQQCARRKVECGGYKKDFKWRPFEDSIVKFNIDKATAGESRGQCTCYRTDRTAASSTASETQPRPIVTRTITTSSVGDTIDASAPEATRAKARRLSKKSEEERAPLTPSVSTSPSQGSTPRAAPSTSSPAVIDPRLTALNRALQSPALDSPGLATYFEALVPTTAHNGASPSLTELLLPYTESSPITDDYIPFQIPPDFSIPLLGDLAFDAQLPLDTTLPLLADDDEDIEDILPLPSSDIATLHTSLPSPRFRLQQLNGPIDYLYTEPDFAPDSPEMLCLRFDRLTCGILSVMDGPTENPWRSLIWPLTQQSPALYHAVTAMTAYHSSSDVPMLRMAGHEHKQASIRYIQEGIRDNSMTHQTAIATALALGFSESWDQHTASGNTHIKGAQALVRRALAEHRKNPLQGEELARLKFLCNAWVYMDVIARLTAVDSDESNDFDSTFLFNPGSPISIVGDEQPGFGLDFGMPIDARLDPLMGCASTLFPLIGRVANLVKRVFRSRSNSPSMISQANDLKLLLETWEPPAFIEPPEDPTSQVQHALQTAEAYRWATLLHLHQSVPELPSVSSVELGQKVLAYLATVPLASRTIIVQIYPLLAAGCEANTEEDRDWVRDRWQAMNARMRIGGLEKCAVVAEEVWRRRDSYESQPTRHRRLVSTSELQPPRAGERLKRPHSGFRNDSLPFDWADVLGDRSQEDSRPARRSNARDIGAMDPAYTVRGHLHWVGVMFEYGWEILLG